MFENVVQFAVELIRALLVDELSGRVRKRLRRMLARRTQNDGRGIIWSIHQRTRQRLLHRMFTEPDDDL
jgi:hypothetical protein